MPAPPEKPDPAGIPAPPAAAGTPSKPAAAVPLTTSRPELLVDGTDRMFRKLVHDFLAFTARHEALRNGHAARIGLAGIDYTILISLAHLSRGGSVNVKTLSDHLHVSTGFVTNVTRKLQELGLIEKRRDLTDRRKTDLTVTAKGLARLEKLAPYQRRVNDAEFGSLTRAQFLQLCTIVEDLVGTSDDALALQRELERDLAAAADS